MKIIKNLLAAAFALVSLSTQAQTADEIMSKNIEAMGGTAKLASLNSVKMSGTLTVQGMDIPVTITRQQGVGSRLDLDVQGTSNYRIYTPTKGYTFFPAIMGMTEPQEMEADQLKAGLSQLDLHGTFVNYKEKGMTVEYTGMDGNDYKLKVTDKYGNKSEYYIDKTTNRTTKIKSTVKGPDGNDTDVETSLSGYKQNADGYWFPYETTTPNGPITYDKIETNITVDPKLFQN